MKKTILILFLFYWGINAIIFQSCSSNNKNNKQKGEIIWNNESDGYFIDIRDNKQYKVIKLGQQIIMAENLAFKPSSGNYWAYNDDMNNVVKYGYLYDWDTANKIAPVGWHLPTNDEWQTFANSLSDSRNVTEIYTKIILGGSSGFNALLSGFRFADNTYNYIGNACFFWSATPYEDSAAVDFGCISSNKVANVTINYRNCGFSVRFFKNNQ